MKCLATCRQWCRRAEAGSTVRAGREDSTIRRRRLYIFRPDHIHVGPCHGDLFIYCPRSRGHSILTQILSSSKPGPVVVAGLEKYVVCSGTIVLPGDIDIVRRSGHHGGRGRPIIAKVELANQESLAIVGASAKQYVRGTSW